MRWLGKTTAEKRSERYPCTLELKSPPVCCYTMFRLLLLFPQLDFESWFGGKPQEILPIRACFCVSVCDTGKFFCETSCNYSSEVELALSHVTWNPCISAVFCSRAVREVDMVSQRITLEGKYFIGNRAVVKPAAPAHSH